MPQVIGVIGLIASVAGTVAGQVTAAGARRDARNAAKLAADIQLSQINDEQAAAETDLTRRARKLAGAQRAAFGASGVELTGSPLDVLLETESNLLSSLTRTRKSFDSQRQLVLAGLGRTNQSIDAAGLQAGASGIQALGGTLLTGAQFFTRNAGFTALGTTEFPTATPAQPPAVIPSGTVVSNQTIAT